MSDEAQQLEEWYRVADLAPPAGVVVLVIWDGRVPFSAARVKHPTTGAPCWLTHDAGRPVLLPTKAEPPNPSTPWTGWHTLKGVCPTYWRPKHPDKWQGPLPEAVMLAAFDTPGRMWSASQRRAKSIDTSGVNVSGMSAAEMAREMEDMREEARAADAPPEPPPEPQWWLDPAKVTRSQPGSISMNEAEGRLMRAFNTEWWVRVEWPRCKTSAEVLADMSKSLPLSADEAAAQPPRSTRPEPTGIDQDDMLPALAWLRSLRGAFRRGLTAKASNGEAFVDGVETYLERVILRAQPEAEEVLRLRGGTPALTWKRIGREIGKSDEAARWIYQSALAEITAAANGGTTPEVEAVREKRQAERRRLDALGAQRKAKRAAERAGA